MSDQIITCPHCHKEIPLTEALTHGLREAIRDELMADVTRREEQIKVEREKLAASQKQITEREEALEQRVNSEIKKREGEIAKKIEARQREESAEEMKLLKDELAEGRRKIKEFSQNELELRKKTRELEEKTEALQLEVQRQLDAERGKIRADAETKILDEHRAKDAEKDKLIHDMRIQMDEMKRKMEQGSQQLQGEVLELRLEEQLRAAFPLDKIEPVAKGQKGADVIQRVINQRGESCGAIVWESKQTKAWSPGWLQKLKDDQRTVKGDMAVIVSAALPADIKSFAYRDGVFISSIESALPLAHALRMTLEQLNLAKQAGEGKTQKMELVYTYLSGVEFRSRIEAILETFHTMSSELQKERNAFTKIWAAREMQLRNVIQNTAGLYGDLAGIIGSTLPKIEGIGIESIPTIESVSSKVGPNQKEIPF
ncbi:DUF2130 domain-containing protein [Candidatus Sumerlaeota bacterium]|nr:DUF2130 domain-containing protein [Candidatus Sumerlaeota bacterium]